MSQSDTINVLGLFPALESAGYGGVQASGREAWEGIVSRFGARVRALHYEGGSSKAMAAFRAFQQRNRAEVILVWHLHLLKLLPFLDHSASRVVLFLHGVEAWPKQDLMTQLLLRKVGLILTNSDHTLNRFLRCNPEFGGVANMTVPLGLGAPSHAPTPVSSKTPAVLMVGRMDKSEDYKGHREMIEAWPRVLSSMPDAQLWIAGAGNLRPELESLARNRTPDGAVRFYGQISDIEKEQLIAQSRCLALPSRGEGFGLVYLEAMRMGRPCLVSDADAGREVVNPPEAGLAVNPNNPAEIAGAVERLLTPGTEWDEWSSRARLRYERSYCSEQFKQRLLSALFDN